MFLKDFLPVSGGNNGEVKIKPREPYQMPEKAARNIPFFILISISWGKIVFPLGDKGLKGALGSFYQK
jgi:hypothetical protein